MRRRTRMITIIMGMITIIMTTTMTITTVTIMRMVITGTSMENRRMG